MAFTREFIRKTAKESGVELPKEFEDALVQEHLSARDAYATGQVKTALEENKDLKKEFEDYKAEQAKKESRTAKETAYRALLKAAGVSEKRMDTILRCSDVDGVELNEKGEIADAKDRLKSIKDEWADFIETVEVRGAVTPDPPANISGPKTTVEEIDKIKDTEARQNAMAQNLELFGIK